MRDLLERNGDIDSVFLCSDLMAFTAIDEIRASGRKVPEDVAVIGYDDVAIAAHSDPPLTTVRQAGPLAGRLLAQSLIQHLHTGAVTRSRSRRSSSFEHQPEFLFPLFATGSSTERSYR